MNSGSQQAITQGYTCPVLDNGHGCGHLAMTRNSAGGRTRIAHCTEQPNTLKTGYLKRRKHDRAHVPPKTIDKKGLAEILGITVSTLVRKPAHELPPEIEGYKNRWYYPTVDRWLIERSMMPNSPKPRDRKPSGFCVSTPLLYQKEQ